MKPDDCGVFCVEGAGREPGAISVAGIDSTVASALALAAFRAEVGSGAGVSVETGIDTGTCAEADAAAIPPAAPLLAICNADSYAYRSR
ncbi:hypothetical protein GCM10011400_67930 [Paraburkholderia caffeinilytica]|uniref:Uncharacterized protein n=1 Tax=Paraburkholderia caffeinilytica TaxID=1761016 RepID=A0ABQ1NCG4_9BURK|nr:hypothetical protein GCM10011400_67930 [Paraburkholderia caffeinilytica]